MLLAAVNCFTAISNGRTNMMSHVVTFRSAKEVTKKLNSDAQ